jgi:Putative enzyme of poly-gamma-glutamate biosynthesis (capsule formation)
MRKRNIFLLILICILSICAFTGLLVYAFHLQNVKDQDGSAARMKLHSSSREKAAQTATAVPSKPAQVSNTPSKENIKQNNPSAAVTVTPTPAIQENTQADNNHPIVLGFAGDVNLDENSYPSAKYDLEKQKIEGCFSGDLLNEMNGADIMMLNNEFSYSTRGTKASDKSFTFRANPSRVEILKKMGVDIVSLANNHALDYGQDALLDSFDTLKEAGIRYIGAGENLAQAKAPAYYTVDGKKIAFVAASRVVFSMDWYASENSPGMIGTYDPALILESIKEAKANSDFVVMFVHWGIERENYPVDYQRSLAQQYIDAGADAVIGCHPHVMQGFEYYKGKPIAYSLGNFWFNRATDKSGLLKLYLSQDGSVKMQLLPAATKDTFAYLLTAEAEKKSYFDFMKKISFGVDIDENGYITSTK